MSQIASYSDLLTAAAVRSQSARVTEHVRAGSGLFWIDDGALDRCSQHVAKTTLDRYPTLEIPYHSRWRHFDAPGSLLRAKLQERIVDLEPLEQARVGFDLVVPSVLLDAGAGPVWAYKAEGCDAPIGRSEGLGLASLAMFLDGKFSNEESLRSDSRALIGLSLEDLRVGFQVTESNSLLALDGRRAVLNSLGHAISSRPDVFPTGRLGELVDHLLGLGPITASAILETVLDVLAPIWPARLERGGLSLGDAWIYLPLGDGPQGIVPFHKLSQWLTYSLVETLEKSGIAVSGIEQLTGLPEYRNGGLLYETGVIGLHDESLSHQAHEPASQLIVEWRALTITQLDEVAERVRKILGRPDLLLAEILEGGTWAAGRRLAFDRDPSGRPPLELLSDGTVF